MTNDKKNSIERAEFPEQVGVSSNVIAEYIEDLIGNNIEVHSIMILRHGKVAFECWREPYGPDIPHTMYSVSKSFTSTAIGFAIDEGLLTLDTRVVDIFPEYKPDKRDENLEKLTVFHLLTMTAGKDVSLLAKKSKNQWIKDFFDAKWKFAPGESFRYVNENIFMLSAILIRLTGMAIIDYLTPRLFEPLGIDRKPFWETDGNGIEAGGWGLYITTEEFAKFILCYSQVGKFNGKQVIPAEWAREAVKEQVSNENNEGQDSSVGYGFCFWRNSCLDSYRADGMFSQYGFVFEKQDAALIITSCEVKGQKSRNCIWRHFPEAFIDESIERRCKPDFTGSLKLPALPELAALPRSQVEKKIAGKIIKIKNQPLLKLLGLPVSIFTIPLVFISSFTGGNITEVRFSFSEDECAMCWREGLEKNTVLCGLEGTPRISQIRLGKMNFTASCTAAWEDSNTLAIWIRPLEAVCQQRIKFVFSGNEVKVVPSSCPETKIILESLTSNVRRIARNPVAVKMVDLVMMKGYKLVESTHYGKIR